MPKKIQNSKKAPLAKKINVTSHKKWLFISIIVAFGLIGVKTTFFSNATAFQYAGTHLQASTETTAWAQSLGSLAAWNGKVYGGYGDWNDNTGPMAITPYDPATGQFASTPEAWADTEAAESPRVIGNKLYFPSTDPRIKDDYTVGEVSSTGQVTWTGRSDMGMIHVFDIASPDNGQTLFLAGSKTYNGLDHAVVYRSGDAGASWSLSLDSPNPDTTGDARMSYVASYGGKIYAQQYNFSSGGGLISGSAANAWVYSGTSWSKARAINVPIPSRGAEFAGKLLAKLGTSLYAYDGNSTSSLGNKGIYTIGDDGYLYAIEQTYSTTDNTLYVTRTKDLNTWTRIAAAPSNVASIAKQGQYIYLGTYDSKLYKANLDDTGTDVTAPQVSVTAPANGTTISTLANALSATATDAGGIRKVVFYIDSTQIGTVTSGKNDTYSVAWDGYGVTPGQHNVIAIAYDTYGNSTTSAPATITIPDGLVPVDTILPTVTLTSPTSLSNIRKSTYISASATDNDKVARMEVTLDGSLITTSNSGSIGANLPLRRGAHTLTITAQDRYGNKASKDFAFTSR